MKIMKGRIHNYNDHPERMPPKRQVVKTYKD